MKVVEELYESVCQNLAALRSMITNLALLDLLTSFTAVVRDGGGSFCKPEYEDGRLELAQARHPWLGGSSDINIPTWLSVHEMSERKAKQVSLLLFLLKNKLTPC